MGHIRQLSIDDYEAVSALSQFAFQYKLTDEEVKKKQKQESNHEIFGYDVDGALAGKLHLIPLSVYLGDDVMEMGGIASVATWPEYRRQGLARKLIRHALERMDEKGIPLSYLHPFNVGFYRRLGWELSFDQYQLRIPTDRLKVMQADEGTYVRRTKDLKDVKAIYAQFAQHYNGMLARDDHWWETRVLSEDKWYIAVSYNEANQGEAYVIYHVKDRELHIKDYGFTNMSGKRSLFHFIANHDSMAEYVNLTMPADDLLHVSLNNTRLDSKHWPYFMARIVNVESFFKAYPFKAGNMQLTIKVTDDFYEKNNGVYDVRIADSHVRVAKVNTEKADLTCSIQALTSIMLGYHCPIKLLENEWIEGDSQRISSFAALLNTKQTFLADFF